MPVVFNLRHLEEHNLFLKGDLPAAELDLSGVDELIHVTQPLSYNLQVQRMDKGVLVQGTLRLPLECECGRCLTRYPHLLALEPWACHLALEGEEKVAVINDCVDLTSHIREDILLAFPQHPLCKPECEGLVSMRGNCKTPENAPESNSTSSAWAELNKLKI